MVKVKMVQEGDGASKKVLSARDKWILQLFHFMGQHIQRSTHPKTLGPRKSAVAAAAPPAAPVAGASELQPPVAAAPTQRPGTSSVALVAPSANATVEAAQLLLDKVRNLLLFIYVYSSLFYISQIFQIFGTGILHKITY